MPAFFNHRTTPFQTPNRKTLRWAGATLRSFNRRTRTLFDMFRVMSLAKVEKQALALNENERARLIASLFETLHPDVEISDEEVLQREAALESGRAEEISHQEFVQRVERERAR
jgi:hypothetical protein